MPEDLRAIRRKIRTVGNICQITRAMKMVAAARLRRLQQRVVASRRYWLGVRALAGRVISELPGLDHPYLPRGQLQRAGLVVVGGDRGLCGNYHALLFRLAEQAYQELPVDELIVIGAKARRWAELRQLKPAACLPALGGRGAEKLDREVTQWLLARFAERSWDSLYAVHTPFASPLHNVPRVTRILPLEAPAAPAQRAELANYLFEPSLGEVVGELLPRAAAAHLCQIMVEAATAEQAARMTAMSTATENAEKLAADLQRLHNRLRQQEITMEMLDVVGGAEALARE
jgi:F-type H+-transporting ATPase subunit gamma